MWLFDTTGDTISVLPKIFLRKNKNELIRMLHEQLEINIILKMNFTFYKMQ